METWMTEGNKSLRPLLFHALIILIFMLHIFVIPDVYAEGKATNESLDEKVEIFLESHRDTWKDLNIPAIDGKILYDLIIKNNYKNALEIGTSTGRSTIWIAWALSKTGGKVITIEINEKRFLEALANFKEAGLSDFIDARLADAHTLVKELKGPFDFVFNDADKSWYTNYFIDVYPKLKIGGCYTAHNISDRKSDKSWAKGAYEFYGYIKSLPNMETTLDSSGEGISISYKISAD